MNGACTFILLGCLTALLLNIGLIRDWWRLRRATANWPRTCDGEIVECGVNCECHRWSCEWDYLYANGGTCTSDDENCPCGKRYRWLPAKP